MEYVFKIILRIYNKNQKLHIYTLASQQMNNLIKKQEEIEMHLPKRILYVFEINFLFSQGFMSTLNARLK